MGSHICSYYKLCTMFVAGLTCVWGYTFQFIYSIFIYTAAMNAAIEMVTDMNSVDETAGSIQVCAVITGVSGALECVVTNIPTLTGSTKAGM